MKRLIILTSVLVLMLAGSAGAAQLVIDTVGTYDTPQKMMQAADDNFDELYGKWTALGATHDTSGELDALYEGELDNLAGLAAALSNEGAYMPTLLGFADAAAVLAGIGAQPLIETPTNFTINDETPSVAGHYVFATANAATPTTITQFDGMTAGQSFIIRIGDVSTTVDFSQANLIGNNEISRTMTTGDVMYCYSVDGTVAACAITATTLTAGTYIDVSGNTITFDATETDDVTWGAAAGTDKTWTWDTGAGTDPTMNFSDTGITFNIFPITPSAAPDADYEVANKKYVDDNVGAPTNITPVDTGDENATFYIPLVDGATGSQATETDAGLSYNPSTNVLSVGSISPAEVADPYGTWNSTGTDLYIQTDAGAYFEFTSDTTAGSNVFFKVAPAGITLPDGVMFIKEQAEADADVEAYGQIWVNTATPNELYFTDDAGTDHQLGIAGSDDQTLAEVLASGADANDLDITSVDKLEGFDAAVYVDLGANELIEIVSDGSIELTTPQVDLDSDAVVLGFGADSDVSLTHVADTGLLLGTPATFQLQFRDSAIYINSGADGYLDLEADTGIRFNGPVTFVNEGDIDLPDNSVDAADIASFYAYANIPVAWMKDGSSAPDAIDDASTRSPYAYRTFASDADEDLNFVWFVPSDLSGSVIQFRVKYLVTNATGPSSEGVAFGLSGVSLGDNDATNGAKGSVVVITDPTITAAQHDVLITGWSGDVTITNLAAGEVAELAFIRDVSDAADDYGQVVGVIAVELRYTKNPA